MSKGFNNSVVLTQNSSGVSHSSLDLMFANKTRGIALLHLSIFNMHIQGNPELLRGWYPARERDYLSNGKFNLR